MFLGFLQLFRPLNLLLGALAIVISSSILEVEVPFIILQTVFVVIILNAAANPFNDYMDSETDKINRPDRPIPKGAISKMTALIAAILLFVAGITLSAFLNSDAFIIASLITVPLMIAYSLWFKGWPLFGNIVVALILEAPIDGARGNSQEPGGELLDASGADALLAAPYPRGHRGGDGFRRVSS